MAKFRASRRLRFEDTKSIISPEIRPKSFGTFEKQAPGVYSQYLKSLSPLFFSIFDEELSHPWIQIQKKQLNFLRLSMGFDRKNIKI